MIRNTELLERTMQHILDHPSSHHQEAWVTPGVGDCGTAACFAGWACLLSGMDRQVVAEESFYRGGLGPCAGTLLGLLREERMILFSGANTIEMLQLMVKDLVNDAPMKDLCTYYDEAENPSRENAVTRGSTV